MEKLISKFLRKQRMIRELTQKEVADKLGIKRVNYAYFELHGRLQSKTLLDFLSALDIPLSSLDSIIQEYRIEEQRRKTREEVNSILNDPTFHNMTWFFVHHRLIRKCCRLPLQCYS